MCVGFLAPMLHTVGAVCAWTLRATRSQHASPPLLPEMAVVESVTEFCLLVGRASSAQLPLLPRLSAGSAFSAEWARIGDFADACLHALPLSNPYTKARLAEVLLFCFTSNPDSGALNALEPLLDGYRQLPAALIALYCDVENTGAAGQFYEKFNIRHQLSVLLRSLWLRHPRHRQSIISLSSRDPSFIRFVNLMINDVTFLLDESMEKLAQIHGIQFGDAARDPEAGDGDVEHLERIARSCLLLARQSLTLMCDVSTTILEPFVGEELGADRLAGMLLLNMRTLTGPKCRQLKVHLADSSAGEHYFQPRELLSLLTRLTLNMSHCERFVEGLARDERSWTDGLLPRITQIMSTSAAYSHRDLSGPLQALHERVLVLRRDAHSNSSDALVALVDEAPEEFVDPLTYTLMTDPVRLRTSGQHLSRATLKTIMLNDAHDPFNRAELVWERDVEEAEELKQRVHAWVEARRAERK